jgi:hypothetical protein
MKWSFVIQQKLKAAALLGGIMILIILGSLISRQNMQGVDNSLSSIYQDRLIPATTIIYLTENLYGKRLTLEKHLFSPESATAAEVKAQLASYDKRIDSLVRIFEKTYLVDQESKSLDDFKQEVSNYIVLENRILELCESGFIHEGKSAFAKGGAVTFQGTINNLHDLTSIQSDVGKNLMKESKSDVASFGVISFLQISLVIIIGLIVQVLIQSDRIINRPKTSAGKKQYFNLN